MTSVATTVPITITSTNSFGSTVVVTTEITTTTSIPVPTPTPTPTNNTGAIVGGVVGGIAAFALLALLLFCLRRRRRRDEFDGNFDPDRVLSHPSGGGTLPQVDLGEENEITPYPDRGTSMRQYGESPFLAAGAGIPAGAAAAGIHRTTSPLSSPSQYSDTATSPAEGYPSQGFVRPGPSQYPQPGPNMYAMQQADWHNPRPLTSPAPSVSNASSSSRVMKEREAAAGRQGLGLATQQEVDGEGSGVVQHEDGGQAHSEEGGGEPRDVPPAYESIRQ
ncbi:hypothetical protein EV702DRAFT_1146015 [Suillus placidus]|uniref:Uncharacterized protein n=1 Tax=Suillus placidus TaxID=48579 RepID=A0A9P6ZIN4_9AGAM|nr:hypothetical protein EV702DRAFT_1146015 [Suillus placidus]